MKRIATLDVNMDGSLKVRRHTLVITNCEGSSNSREKIKGDGQASSHRAIVQEANDLEEETRSVEAPKTSKNVEGFQHGPANDKSLKHHFPSRQLLEHTPEYEPKLFI